MEYTVRIRRTLRNLWNKCNCIGFSINIDGVTIIEKFDMSLSKYESGRSQSVNYVITFNPTYKKWEMSHDDGRNFNCGGNTYCFSFCQTKDQLDRFDQPPGSDGDYVRQYPFLPQYQIRSNPIRVFMKIFGGIWVFVGCSCLLFLWINSLIDMLFS